MLAVAERDVLRLGGKVDDVDELAHRDALAGEGGFLDLHAGACENAAVRRDRVAGLEDHHVANDKILAVDGDHLPVAQHLGCRRRHLLQSFDGLFRLALLVDAEHRVDDDDGENDDDVGKALALNHGENAADRRGDEQNDDHRVAHLLEKPLDERVLLALGQLVFAVGCEALFRLGARETFGCAVHVAQYGFGFFAIESQRKPLLIDVRMCFYGDKKTRGQKRQYDSAHGSGHFMQTRRKTAE